MRFGAAAALAAPPKPGTGTSKPVPPPPGSVALALSDLELSRVDLNMLTKEGTMPGGSRAGASAFIR